MCNDQKSYQDFGRLVTKNERKNTYADIIAQARAICNPNDHSASQSTDVRDWLHAKRYRELCEIVPKLADIAEQRGAMLYEAYAASLVEADECGEMTKEECLNEAKEILAIEANHWQKIGPDQVAAIERVIKYTWFALEGSQARQDAEVLRRLLPEDA
jgi:hypothetical protein